MKRDYNLFELTKLISQICDAHPHVNDFFTSVYRLNDTDNIVYPVVSLTINNITANENTIDYNINLLYADRLTENRDNNISIQSIGTTTLIEIINFLGEKTTLLKPLGYQITPFMEQFADNCSGVFSQLTLKAPNYIGSCHWIDSKCIDCL